MTDLMPIDQIVVGQRLRKEMGDLKGLAESIKRHGLLHPIVVKADRTLVAGHRRIEAARLLGWTEIQMTVIDVDDLLSAERDENRDRKDFTPTEAEAIGRLIEEQERLKSARARSLGASKRWAKSRGEVIVHETQTTTRRGIAERAARAVGMGPERYVQAKAIVAAAEAEPETFGDLPALMDKTNNVSAAHQEMERRKGTSSQRHPIHRNRHNPKAARIIASAVTALEGLCVALDDIDQESLRELDQSEAASWANAFEESAARVKKFARRMRG